jgi:hypothetical protein
MLSMSTLGRLACSLVLLLVLLGILSGLGVDRKFGSGLAVSVWVAIEAGLMLRKSRLAKRASEQVHSLQAQIHALEEEDLKLRAAEARKRGDFDQFGGKQ